MVLLEVKDYKLGIENFQRMKCIIPTLLLVITMSSMQAQTEIILQKGTVSFVSSKNVYVKFDNTKELTIGDTLLWNQNSRLLPALVITNKSSSSTVCEPIIERKFKKGEELTARIIKAIIVEKEEVVLPRDNKEFPPNTPVLTPDEDEEVGIKQKIRGRVSVASYSSLSNYRNRHRMRYAFSFRGDNLGGSKLSTDAYVTFRHTIGEWDAVKNNIGRALKVYSLSASYDFTPDTRLTIGRKINPKLSSVGAIDGTQLEKSFGKILVGAVAGTRPDYSNYGFNLNLFQYGAYMSLSSSQKNKFGHTTFGFMEQSNNGLIDRRFTYFQHSGQLTKQLHLFSSFEVDLYEKINNQINNQPQLTNLYVSLRYRFSKTLRLSASFDSRKNIIYYESYKSFIDQLIEDETRQGLRFGFTFRPIKNITWGINTGMRFQNSGKNTSRNFNTYVSLGKMPWLNLRTTIRASLLETDFLNSFIYGIRFSKPLVKKKLNAELYYRNVNYLYKNSDAGTAVRQHIGGLSLSYRLTRKLSWHVFYEGTFDKNNPTFSRINMRLIKRF